jgi:hypothetical protein
MNRAHQPHACHRSCTVRHAVIGATFALACRMAGGDAPTPVAAGQTSGSSSTTPIMDGPLSEGAQSSATQPQGTEATMFPAPWCARAIPDAYEVLSSVAVTYIETQYGTCATAQLTKDLDNEHVLAWINYLIDYTHAIAGCDLPDPSLGGRGFLPGGIRRFGPANLEAIDLAQPRFGRSEAGQLIEQYVASFSQPLQLSTAEQAALTSFLATASEEHIDEAFAGSLSACGEPSASND